MGLYPGVPILLWSEMTPSPSVNDLFYGAVACGLLVLAVVVVAGLSLWYWWPA